jgi:carbon-monoxide dehydrogenase catalytic subunit
VTSGAHVIFQDLPINGAKKFSDYLLKEIKEEYGACWGVEENPLDIAKAMIAAIDGKREALGINKKKERVLMDMAMRRELEGGGVAGAGCGG